MWLSLYLARRYLFSRSLRNVVNVISLISALGVAGGAMALIIVLSAFNGFEKVINQLYTTFDAELKVVPATGKYFALDSAQLAQMAGLPGVAALSPVIEENVLLQYRDQQSIATMKAIDQDYLETTGFDSMVRHGIPLLEEEHFNYAILGAGVASKLGIVLEDHENPLKIYIPRKGEVSLIHYATTAFHQANTTVSGVFSIQQEFDQRFAIVPLRLARKLLRNDTTYTSIEINVSPGKAAQAKAAILALAGDQVRVLTRQEQQPLIFKVMRSERLVVYLILTFILLLAAFNLVGALMMVAIEKQKDLAVLNSFGLPSSSIRNILLQAGVLLTVGGGLVGLAVGTVICWLQMQYGLVAISSAENTFVVQAYPIELRIGDYLLITATVVALGLLASWLPAHMAARHIKPGLLRARV